jgi:hypothetical protein
MIKRFLSVRHDHEEYVVENCAGVFYVGVGDQFDDDRRLVRVVASGAHLVKRPARQASRLELPVLFDRRAYMRLCNGPNQHRHDFCRTRGSNGLGTQGL